MGWLAVTRVTSSCLFLLLFHVSKAFLTSGALKSACGSVNNRALRRTQIASCISYDSPHSRRTNRRPSPHALSCYLLLGGNEADLTELISSGNDFLGTVNGLGDAAAQQATGTLDSINGQAADLVSGFTSVFSGLQDQVTGATQSVTEFVGSLGEQITRPFTSAIENVEGTVEASKQGLFKDITSAVSDVITSTGINTEEVIRGEQEVASTVSQVVTEAEKILTPRNTFSAENIAILPLWLGMILRPDSKIVRRTMESYVPIVLAAFIYAWLTYEALKNPTSLDGFSSGVLDLESLTKGFTEEVAVATVWAHIIAQDLFVGRWVYLDATRNKVFAGHSLVLCFLFGPLGALSHLLTRGVVGIFRRDVRDIMEEALPLAAVRASPPSSSLRPLTAPSAPPPPPPSSSKGRRSASPPPSSPSSSSSAPTSSSAAVLQKAEEVAKEKAAVILQQAKVMADDIVRQATAEADRQLQAASTEVAAVKADKVSAGGDGGDGGGGGGGGGDGSGGGGGGDGGGGGGGDGSKESSKGGVDSI